MAKKKPGQGSTPVPGRGPSRPRSGPVQEKEGAKGRSKQGEARRTTAAQDPRKQTFFGKVPPIDAFENLPPRRPPGLAAEAEPQPEEEKKKGFFRKRSGKAGAPKQVPPGSREAPEAKKEGKTQPPKVVSPAKRRRNRQIATIAASVLIIVAGVFFSINVLFKIQEFELEGESPYTLEEIVRVFGSEPGDGMFSYSGGVAAARICEELPYIESVQIRRKLPSTIVFRVEVAQERFCFEYQGQWAVLSGTLKVLALVDEQPEGLTELRGMVAVAAQPGQLLRADATLPDSVYVAPESVLPESVGSGAISFPDFTGRSEAESEASIPPGGAWPPEGSLPTDESVPAVSSEEEVESKVQRQPTLADGENALATLDLLLKALEDAGMAAEVNWIDIRDSLNISFRWQSRITVILGSITALEEKMIFVTTLLFDPDPQKRQIGEEDRGILNVSAYPLASERVYFAPELS